MDEEFNKILEDRFEAAELVELLQIHISEVVFVFQEYIQENREFLEEFLHVGA